MLGNSTFSPTSLKHLPLRQIFELNCLIFLYKCIKTDQFPEFKRRTLNNPSIRNYNTRWANTIRTPSVRLDICKRSYFYKGITLWNKLDKKIQDSKSIDIFKKSEILPIPNEQFISYLYFLTISKDMLSLPFIFNL